ncbi:MAG: lamin tail domain-containing protein, partial [Verrucomicrobia bacterium]|nr:lamin tail domain-containing protein [Verrucomicrobiota bacterium]
MLHSPNFDLVPAPRGASQRGARRLSALLPAWLFALTLFLPSGRGQSILREVWEGIPGNAVADLTSSPDYPARPTSTNFVTDLFEAPVNSLDSYGQRMHGYVVPPVTGNYTFWIASDDGGELWLSTDVSSANQKLIATVNGWTSSREWTREPNQESSAIRLEAGRAYYIAALQKEGGGGDNLAVRWRRPDGADEGPIPATHLLPFGVAFGPPTIAEQPANTTVVEGRLATFTVKPGGAGLVSYQWQRNAVNLPDATAAILSYGPTRLADNQARFRVILTNTQGTTNSEPATLTVLADTVKPELAAARNEGRTQVVVEFSEPVAPPTALNPAHYALSRGILINEAKFGADQQTVLLTTTALTFGFEYTLTVNLVTDQAAARNVIAPNSRISFTANDYAPTDIGSPALAGDTVSVPGGVDVTGGGKTIGGSSDQFQFGWQEQVGNFDLETRVAGVSVPDPFVHAGLMARETLDANARFGAAFVSSAQLGCFFESRSTLGGNSATAAPRAGFPANAPFTWLRLQRSGETVIGYASLDGGTWTQLGSATLAGLPARLYVGFAVSGDNEQATATARFRDIGPTRNLSTGTVTFTKEPAGPSSRATGMILSEIMYHPAPRTDGRNLEFIEVHNARSVLEDLTGWRISGDVDFNFPPGLVLPAGETLVIAAAPDDLRAVYGLTNVVGPYTNALPNSGGLIRLRNNADAIRLEVEYSDRPPWPVAADGAGHSLVLARPSYGENDVRAWAASEFRGGSPGTLDPMAPSPDTSVVINEFLAHTDDPVLDFIELYNRSNARVDLSGCALTDDPATNRFRLPPGTFIEPRSFVAWDQNQLGFMLRSGGETIYLINSNQTRVLDAIQFGGQENGVASGRSPDGSTTIRRLTQPTPAAANAPWRREDVVINELMYHPISGDEADEYVELFNRGSQPVALAGWRFEDGIDFTFPAGASLPAGGYAVVARNAARLKTHYTALTAHNTFGDYQGSLRDSGERVALSKPDEVVSTNEFGVRITNLIHIVVSEVTFADGGRWGRYADGGGSSLELIDANADTLRGANWADSDETAKAPWATVEVTGRVDNANGTANRLHVSSLGGGEYLVDDIEVFRAGSTNVVNNGDFENGATAWVFSGNHSQSRVVTSGAASGAACLSLLGLGDGDTGPNTARNTLRASIGNNSTVTIRAKVRWLAGWPQVLFRLHGNGLELAANLTVPRNLGTPGLVNSRRVANAGPAIYDVTHFPPLPAASEQVRVTCRVSDADGVASLRLQYRLDPATTLSNVTLTDDGAGLDEIAGDGIYTGRIPGQTSGRLAAFRITATDDAATPASTVFPAKAPDEECLIRWGDTVPFGTFAHYHLWFTQATRNARQNALDNTFRDATLVYGHERVIYNTGFRDKGSPYHGGAGDIAATTPADEPLLGVQDRIFASTGNGGSEPTAIRSQLAAWYAQQLGIPYLHAHYLRLYFNGSLFREVSEDLEQPNHDYARKWFPTAPAGDLYKIAVWFEFQDDNRNFASTSATLQRFTTLNGEYKTGRYRWNWQRRSNDGDASNYRQLLDLVTVMNDSSSLYVPRALGLANLEQWMRAFCFDYAMGEPGTPGPY